MNNFHSQCLYFADKMNMHEINQHYYEIKQKFEETKFNKHFSKGKTTKHRKGKVEKRMGKIKSSFRKICYIKYYKKQIWHNPNILNNLTDKKFDKGIESFLAYC